MKEGYIYLVIGNRTGGLSHFCEIDSIVIGTGIYDDSFGGDSLDGAHLYRLDDEYAQYIHPDDVFEIGKL